MGISNNVRKDKMDKKNVPVLIYRKGECMILEYLTKPSVLTIWTLTLFMMLPVADVMAQKKAFVFVGSVSGPLCENESLSTAGEVESDFIKFYGKDNVTKNTEATTADIIAALADPNVESICIIAHGNYNFYKQKYEEGVIMRGLDAWFDSDDFPSGTTFPNLKTVIIHSCGQKQQSWKDLFPTATSLDRFYASSGASTPSINYWWQWFFYMTDASPQRQLPDVHESLWSKTFYEVDGRTAACFGSLQNPLFQMSPRLSSEFGLKTFNIIGYEDANSANIVLLVGAIVEDGHVTSYSNNGYANPDFEVLVSETAMFNSLESPAAVFSYENEGIEINNFCSVSSETLFQGFAKVQFSVEGSTGDIPTLSEWGLIIMAVLLLTVGAIAIRRRFKTVPA